MFRQNEGGKCVALLQCPGCGKEVSNKAKKCPKCKKELGGLAIENYANPILNENKREVVERTEDKEHKKDEKNEVEYQRQEKLPLIKRKAFGKESIYLLMMVVLGCEVISLGIN